MKYRKCIFAISAGMLSSFCFVAGKELELNYTLDFMQLDFWCGWFVTTLFCTLAIHGLWSFFDGSLCVPKRLTVCIKKISDKLSDMDEKLEFIGVMIFLFFMWVPAWLSIFPGAFSYDAYDEWMQIVTKNISAHHPVLHVLYLGGITEGIYHLTGNYNIGIAICTGLQMFLLSAVLSYTVVFMREQSVNVLLRLYAILFYAFSPVVQLFAICSTKDTLFTAALLLFIISIYRICLLGKEFYERRSWIILFIVSALFTMILRNNGLYIVMCCLPIIYIVCRREWKRLILVCSVVLVLYYIYIGPFYKVMDVTPGGKQEMLSVPLQQLARLHYFEKESFSDEEIEYLYTIVPEENWNRYSFTLADPVKSGFRQDIFEKEPKKFFELWIASGVKHPLTYMNSFLVGTVDFWYPFAVVDGYGWEMSSYFDYKVSEPGEELIVFAGLHEMYASISHEQETQKLPGMFLVLSPGWYLLLFMLLFLFLWREKEYKKLVVLLPILFNLGTVLLGPIALVRYVLIQFFAFPLYFTLVNKH